MRKNFASLKEIHTDPNNQQTQDTFYETNYCQKYKFPEEQLRGEHQNILHYQTKQLERIIGSEVKVEVIAKIQNYTEEIQKQTNNFIKQLLDQLADVYQKYRWQQNSSEFKTNKLMTQMKGIVQKYKAIQYELTEIKQLRKGQLIHFQQKIKAISNEKQMQLKLLCFELQKYKKDNQNFGEVLKDKEYLLEENQKLSVQLQNFEKIKEEISISRKQNNGYVKLIEEYQLQLERYENYKSEMKISLEKRQLQIQEYSDKMTFKQIQLNIQRKLTKELQQSIRLLQKQGQEQSIRCAQTEKLKKQIIEDQCKIKQFQLKYTDLHEQYQKHLKNVGRDEELIINLKESVKKLNEQILQNKKLLEEQQNRWIYKFQKQQISTNLNLQKIKIKFEQKLKLMNRIYTKKIKQIKHELKAQKQQIKKQLLIYWKSTQRQFRQLVFKFST